MSKTNEVTEILNEIAARVESLARDAEAAGKKTEAIELVAKATQAFFEDWLKNTKVTKKKKKKVKIIQGFTVNKAGNA